MQETYWADSVSKCSVVYLKFCPLMPETMVSAYETNALLRLEESFT
jgi:hypothetical protein